MMLTFELIVVLRRLFCSCFDCLGGLAHLFRCGSFGFGLLGLGLGHVHLSLMKFKETEFRAQRLDLFLFPQLLISVDVVAEGDELCFLVIFSCVKFFEKRGALIYGRAPSWELFGVESVGFGR